jgi:integrase
MVVVRIVRGSGGVKARRGRLTEAYVEGLTKSGFHRDGAVAGFGVLIGARTKAWQLRIERKGRPKVFLTLGHWPDKRASEARAEALDALAKYERREPIKPKPGEATISTILPLYIERLKDDDASPQTLKWYRESVARLSEEIRETPLRELAANPILLADEIAHIRRRLREKSPRKGQSAATSSARCVKTLFRFAQRRDPTLLGDPTSAVSKVDPKRNDLTVLGSKDLPKWWADVQNIPNDVKKWALLFCLLSGLRRSNLVAIEWTDVDLKERCVHVARTKRGTPFDLILSRALVRVLWRSREASRRLYREHAQRFVFGGPKGHMRGDALNRDGVAANHSLRRTFATLAREAGVPKDMVSVLLGHGEHDVTDRYVRRSRLGALYGTAMEDVSLFILRALGGGRVPRGLA